LLRANEQCDLAVPDYDEAIKLSPAVGTYLGRGLCLVEMNQAARAMTDFDQVTTLDPKNAAGYAIFAWVIKARLNLALGNSEAALQNLAQAITLDPKRAGLYIELGNAWDARGDDARALAAYDEAIKLEQTNAT